MPVRLFGEERVAWRGADGVAHVWHNRCLHRGMRLHLGFVDGDRLACRYHGWRFDGDGRCVRIPAHPDMTPPADFCIRAATAMEAGGLIWATLGVSGRPETISADGDAAFVCTVAVQAPAARFVDVLQEIAEGALESSGTGLYEASSDGYRILFAVQPVLADKCQVHVRVRSAGAAEERKRVAARVRRLRRLAEEKRA